jgi:hypothetical protein
LSAYPYTLWVVAGVALLIVGLVGFAAYRYKVASTVEWRPLEGYYKGAVWYSQAEKDPKFVLAAMQQAETQLIAHTKWTAANLALVGHAVQLYIMEKATWTDGWGRPVAGLQSNHVLVVGSDLAALCHELAHLCEKIVDQTEDAEHASWQDSGIFAAINAYEHWLGHRPTELPK